LERLLPARKNATADDWIIELEFFETATVDFAGEEQQQSASEPPSALLDSYNLTCMLWLSPFEAH
jgi:hypothetical protein